ncbi:MAG: glycosyltransferase family 2 protein [Clostridia bacterium]|nr:glycosyltransferase family 2 protein [Clostridia bacterium]
MLNIVIPMAGRGSRFSAAGYELPKPLIPVHGIPMIQVVINNLKPEQEHRFIFLCQQEHIDKYNIHKILLSLEPCCVIVPVDRLTEGAACTVLLAKDFINDNNPLMIANSDQWVDTDINIYLSHIAGGDIDGLIMTMNSDDPKWSYARLHNGNVIEVVEKQVVSDEATVGIYNYQEGRCFVKAAEKMIEKGLRVNGEFYVAPAYNEMIDAGMKISYYNIGSEFNGMYGIGIPSDLERFLSHEISEKAVLKLKFIERSI